MAVSTFGTCRRKAEAAEPAAPRGVRHGCLLRNLRVLRRWQGSMRAKQPRPMESRQDAESTKPEDTTPKTWASICSKAPRLKHPKPQWRAAQSIAAA